MNDRLSRFLGDQPLRLLLRLAILSLAVGVVLAALGIEPYDIVESARRFVVHVWQAGFSTLDRALHYLLLGAAVVVPVWLIARVLNAGGR